MCLTSTFRVTLDDTLSGLLSTLPRRSGRSWVCQEAKGNNKVESKLDGLLGLGVFVVSTLPLLYVIGFSNGLVIPPLSNLINF